MHDRRDMRFGRFPDLLSYFSLSGRRYSLYRSGMGSPIILLDTHSARDASYRDRTTSIDHTILWFAEPLCKSPPDREMDVAPVDVRFGQRRGRIPNALSVLHPLSATASLALALGLSTSPL